MSKHKQAVPHSSPARTASSSGPPHKSNTAPFVRYGIYALIVAAAVGVRFWLAGPDIPLPALDGLDPALAEEIKNARAAIWESPKRPDKWGRLGMLLAAHNFTDEAVICFLQAGELEVDHWKWPYVRSIALETSDAAAARDALREAAVVAGEEELLPKLILIEQLLELGEFDEAERHLTFVLHYEPQHPRGNLDRARLLFARGDEKGCLDLLERAATDRRTRRAAQQLLAQAHRRMGNEKAADEALAQLKSLPPDEAWIDPLREQLESYRTTKGAYIARINELGRIAQHEKLGRAVAEALDRYPELAHLVAGRERLNRGDAMGAETDLREAARLDPRSVDAFLSLGEALVQQDKLPQAEAEFCRAVEVDPINGLAHLALGQCLAAQGKHEPALTSFRSAVHFMPLSAEAHRALADALAKNGQKEEAEVHDRYAKQLEPRQTK